MAPRHCQALWQRFLPASTWGSSISHLDCMGNWGQVISLYYTWLHQWLFWLELFDPFGDRLCHHCRVVVHELRGVFNDSCQPLAALFGKRLGYRLPAFLLRSGHEQLGQLIEVGRWRCLMWGFLEASIGSSPCWQLPLSVIHDFRWAICIIFPNCLSLDLLSLAKQVASMISLVFDLLLPRIQVVWCLGLQVWLYCFSSEISFTDQILRWGALSLYNNFQIARSGFSLLLNIILCPNIFNAILDIIVDISGAHYNSLRPHLEVFLVVWRFIAGERRPGWVLSRIVLRTVMPFRLLSRFLTYRFAYWLDKFFHYCGYIGLLDSDR